MQIQRDVSLQRVNTFGVAATAAHYAQACSPEDVREALMWAKKQGMRTIIMGGGSNILFTDDVDALVLHMVEKKISVRDMGDGKALVEAAAGENWADLVWWAVGEGYGGIENLSLIPGTVGAAPVQNIGAYGAEFRNVCHSVYAVRRDTGAMRRFFAPDCRFGYRDSLFKQESEQWVVTSVEIMLDRQAPLCTDYGALKEKLSACPGKPCFADVAKAVADIRRSKLPSPEDIGNAGSFFKNPVVPAARCQTLRDTYPHMPAFDQNDGTFKLSAAWLIDTAGWKQKSAGNVECYALQALVLVNHGGASGREILQFSRDIQKDIAERFGVQLEREAVTYP